MNATSMTPTATTIELNNTIVALEGLHSAFETVLQKAVDQLDDLKLDDEQLETIISRVSSKRHFIEEITDRVNARFMEDLENKDGQSAVIRYLENRLTSVVWHRLERKINSEVERYVYNDADFDSVISAHLRRHNAFQRTIRENELMSDMVGVIAQKILELKPEDESN